MKELNVRKRVCFCQGYLERVEAGDDAAVLHMAGARGVGELALGVRTRA